jgi:hypothetical protein
MTNFWVYAGHVIHLEQLSEVHYSGLKVQLRWRSKKCAWKYGVETSCKVIMLV